MGHFFHLTRGVFFARRVGNHAVGLAAGDDVEVDVINELSGGTAVVVENVASFGSGGGGHGPGELR